MGSLRHVSFHERSLCMSYSALMSWWHPLTGIVLKVHEVPEAVGTFTMLLKWFKNVFCRKRPAWGLPLTSFLNGLTSLEQCTFLVSSKACLTYKGSLCLICLPASAKHFAYWTSLGKLKLFYCLAVSLNVQHPATACFLKKGKTACFLHSWATILGMPYLEHSLYVWCRVNWFKTGGC